MSDHNDVPMMFRSQVTGRSQLHSLSDDNKGKDKQKDKKSKPKLKGKTKQKEKPKEKDSQRWAREWTEKAYPHPPKFGENVNAYTCKMRWRFVTDGGQDDDIIRPAIGAFGWPFYPGSSMKGIFRTACRKVAPDRVEKYCGTTDQQGSLRFHGGYPIDATWQKNLVDIVHPLQGWQVKTNETDEKSGGAFPLVSLLQPTLRFGISSTDPDTDWDEVWKIWETALGMGLGCRVSSGYGLPDNGSPDSGVEGNGTLTPIKLTAKVLYRAQVKGRGGISTLIDGTPEFRPNIFRAAIRGHAMRIFGGLTDADNATKLVESLFGGITNSATQGLLGLAFDGNCPEPGKLKSNYKKPIFTYDVTGELSWLLLRPDSLDRSDLKTLEKLVRLLTQFAMVFGGFGKSWRRADHRKFYPDYYKDRKPLIGCDWEWEEDSLAKNSAVPSLKAVPQFIKALQKTAIDWMICQEVDIDFNISADWREAWHPDRVQVWGRIAEDDEDSKAIHWLHGPYQEYDRYDPEPKQTQSIYQTSVTGSRQQISRLWHRMYPLVKVRKSKTDPQKKIPIQTSQYIEFLTIFPDKSNDSRYFIDFLERSAGRENGFQLLWPIARS